MAYVDYEFYKSVSDEPMSESDFNRMLWDAEKRVDSATTCVDGFSKLRNAFPTDDYSIQSVKRCICAVLDTTARIKKAENAVGSYVETENGVHRGLISSISSGSESVSYSSNASATIIDKILADKTAQDAFYSDIITASLSGAEDKNGVLLLYSGNYPG